MTAIVLTADDLKPLADGLTALDARVKKLEAPPAPAKSLITALSGMGLALRDGISYSPDECKAHRDAGIKFFVVSTDSRWNPAIFDAPLPDPSADKACLKTVANAQAAGIATIIRLWHPANAGTGALPPVSQRANVQDWAARWSGFIPTLFGPEDGGLLLFNEPVGASGDYDKWLPTLYGGARARQSTHYLAAMPYGNNKAGPWDWLLGLDSFPLKPEPKLLVPFHYYGGFAVERCGHFMAQGMTASWSPPPAKSVPWTQTYSDGMKTDWAAFKAKAAAKGFQTYCDETGIAWYLAPSDADRAAAAKAVKAAGGGAIWHDNGNFDCTDLVGGLETLKLWVKQGLA